MAGASLTGICIEMIFAHDRFFYACFTRLPFGEGYPHIFGRSAFSFGHPAEKNAKHFFLYE
jgi:hypothetical protein